MVIPAALVNSGSGEHFQVTRKRPRARAGERGKEGGRCGYIMGIHGTCLLYSKDNTMTNTEIQYFADQQLINI